MLGLRRMDSESSLFLYVLPEICICYFVMLNFLKLKLIGLYNEDEQEKEDIHFATMRYVTFAFYSQLQTNQTLKPPLSINAEEQKEED